MADDDHITRVCKDCGEEKPMSGFYTYKSGRNTGKPYGNCKACRNAKGAVWRKENPEKSLAYTKNWLAKDDNQSRIDAYKREYMARYRVDKHEVCAAWREKNKARVQEYMREWMRENRPRLREYDRGYRRKNLEIERVRDRRRYAKRKEHFAATAREWRKNNKERHALNQRVNGHKRRARMRNVTGVITAADIKFLLDKQRGKCPVCRKKLGKKYHLDHIVPLVKGGTNELTNAQLLHPICNCSKQARDPIEFMQSRGFLL